MFMEVLKMKKFSILLITAVLSISSITVNAASIPRETSPESATEEAIIITENLISDILDEVANGIGYGSASSRANTRIRKTVIANQTGGYGYGVLSPISQNAIRTMRDMYLRPDYYKQIEKKLKVLLADLIVDVQNGKDFDIAIDEAHTLIYKSADPTYDPAVDRVGDFCYWDIPAVDSAEFTVARKLLLNAIQK